MENLMSRVVARSLQLLAVGAIAFSAIHASAQSYQVANSTAGRQVTAAPINQIVANLNYGINNAQYTASVANNTANYAVNVGANAQDTANYAVNVGANAQNTANYAASAANEAYAHADWALANAHAWTNAVRDELKGNARTAWEYTRQVQHNVCQTQQAAMGIPAYMSAGPCWSMVAGGAPY